jgi:hypothetical protein
MNHEYINFTNTKAEYLLIFLQDNSINATQVLSSNIQDNKNSQYKKDWQKRLERKRRSENEASKNKEINSSLSSTTNTLSQLTLKTNDSFQDPRIIVSRLQGGYDDSQHQTRVNRLILQFEKSVNNYLINSCQSCERLVYSSLMESIKLDENVVLKLNDKLKSPHLTTINND